LLSLWFCFTFEDTCDERNSFEVLWLQGVESSTIQGTFTCLVFLLNVQLIFNQLLIHIDWTCICVVVLNHSTFIDLVVRPSKQTKTKWILTWLGKQYRFQYNQSVMKVHYELSGKSDRSDTLSTVRLLLFCFVFIDLRLLVSITSVKLVREKLIR
jgi:hypothetical protein